MRYGVATFPTDYSIHPAELGPALEERGFESLWVAEHSHIPVSRRTPFPGGGDLPKMYQDVVDPFVALSMAAATTRSLKLATGVCLVAQRDPIQTAKQVASLDRLSEGRFLFGVGGGWNREEMENHGTDYGHRFRLLRERVEAMKAIWTQQEAEYHGELVDFGPVLAWPKPAQRPHPPVHVGGGAPGALRRTVTWGDGWIPLAGRGGDPLQHLPALAAAARAAGRDPASLEVSIYGAPPAKETLTRYREAGVTRAIFFLPSEAKEAALPRLDGFAELAAAVG